MNEIIYYIVVLLFSGSFCFCLCYGWYSFFRPEEDEMSAKERFRLECKLREYIDKKLEEKEADK